MSSLFPAQPLLNTPGDVAAFNFGGANPPSHSGDFSSSFTSFESSEHPGKRTNETSSVPIQVRPFREGYERAVNVGDILFNLLPGMSAYSAPSMAVSEVIVNLPVANRLLLKNPSYFRTETGSPAFVGIFRNEMSLSGKEFFVSNVDPHSRLFNVDVAGTTKVPNIWRGANYKNVVDLVRAGSRVGLARFKVSASKDIPRGPTSESSDGYKPDENAQIIVPVHHHKGKWQVDSTLEQFMEDTYGLVLDEQKFVINLGVITFLGAEHGE